jgi:AAHS family 4-hydroxybenzoate transporter-like MFS transporter
MVIEIDVQEVIDNQKLGAARIRIIAFSLIVMFFDGFDFNMVGYVGPVLMEHFQISKAVFGSAISAGIVGYMIGGFLFSDLGDRLGRKRLIIAGVVLFSTLTFACSFVDSLTAFVILRFIAGIGLGGTISNVVALNTEYAPRRFGAKVVGILFVGYTLGGAAPGWVAAWLMQQYGWQIVFTAGSVIPLVTAIIMIFAMTESVKFLATKPHRRGELIEVLTKLAPHLSISPDSRIVLQEELRKGLPFRLLFANGRALDTILLWVSFVCTIAGLFFVISWTPTLVASLGVPSNKAAFVGAMFLTGGAFGCLLIPRMVDKYGVGTVAISLGLAVPCIMAIGWIGADPFALMGVIFIAGFLGNGSQVGLNSIAAIFYPTAIRSTGVGCALAVGRLGAIVAPVIGGMLISAGTPVRLLFLYASISLAISTSAMALFWLLSRSRRATSDQTQSSLVS